MKKAGIMIGCLIALSLLARPSINPLSTSINRPEMFSGTGGPDAYGYTWIDNNDTTLPGAPTYHWIDITKIGTEVTGLGDDNTVGPFDIGFQFPYYWYKVDKFYICSNGVISFSDKDVWISHSGGGGTGGQIPSPQRPNDVVAPLGGDLKFTPDRGKVYYYTNNKDSLIVSYIDVPEWHRGVPGEIFGSHTFQIILTKEDSSITFQYGPQDGDFHYDTDVEVTNAIGIENNTGTIGLQYLRNNQPAENMYREGLAVKIIPPETTSYEVRDVAVTDVMSEGSRGIFVHINQSIPLWVRVRNVGNQPMSDITVVCSITDEVGNTIYQNNLSINSLKVGEIKKVDFPSWKADLEGTYTMISYISVASDMNPTNDMSDAELKVIHYPCRLSYWEEGDSLGATGFGVNSGMGVKYTPPSYPVNIDTVFIALADSLHPTDMALHIYKDDGPDGLPGTLLWADTFAIPDSEGGWNVKFFSFPITPSVKIESGSFYVVGIQIEEGILYFLTSEDPPFSRQNWEVLDGTFAPYRGNEESDLYMAVSVRGQFGIEENPNKPQPHLLFSIHPSTLLKDKAVISFTTSYRGRVNLSVYDVSGRLLENLMDGEIEPGVHKIIWDNKRVPSGVYFINLRFAGKSLTKKLVLVK